MRRIIDVSHHRNGSGGNPFYVVRFRNGRQKMLGIVFEDEPRSVAVFDSDLLAQDVIAFGQNSWRGDDYEHFLRDAAKQYDEKLRAANTGEAIWKVMQGGPKVWARKRETPATAKERQ